MKFLKNLKNRIESWPDWKIAVFLYLAFAVPTVFAASFLRVAVVNDTVATMASAAALAGDDWSMMVKKLGARSYKPGIALLYYPLYVLLHADPVMMYRLMCVSDMLLISFLPVCAYFILHRHLRVSGKAESMIGAAASAGLSSIWLYSSFPKGDVLLIFLPLPALLLLLEIVRGPKGTLRRAGFSVLLAFLLVSAYLAHTRGIVLLIAGVMVCLLAALTVRGRRTVHWPAFILSLAVFFLAANRVSAACKAMVFRNFDAVMNTFDGFEYETLMNIFSAAGVKTLFRLCTGWLFNLFVSTYGIAIAGIVAAVVLLWKGFVRRQGTDAERVTAAFSLLYAAGCFALGILFFFPSAWRFVQEIAVDRADRMFYGRYMVTAVPPLLLTAFYTFCLRGERPRKALLLIVPVFAAVAAVFLLKLARPYADSRMSVHFYSLATFLPYEGTVYTWFPEIVTALSKITLVNGAVMLGFVFLVCCRKKAVPALALILCASVINFTVCFVRIRLRTDEAYYHADERVIAQLQELEDAGLLADCPKIAADGAGFNGKVYQFRFPGLSFGYGGSIAAEQPEFLVITRPGLLKGLAAEWDARNGKADYYILYRDPEKLDCIYVRGEGLARRLTEAGYTLSEVLKDQK